MKNQQHQPIMAACPHCNAVVEIDQHTVVDEDTQLSLTLGRCSSCLLTHLIMVIGQGPMVTSIGMLTDLQSCDAPLLQRNESITDDDVISLHSTLLERNAAELFVERS